MPSKRDQLQSYQFMLRRVISALTLRETDPLNPPFGRLIGSAFASVMIAVLVACVVLIIGIIFPGGNASWQSNDTVVVVKETGAIFVYRNNVLYPMANITSARLMTAASGAQAQAAQAQAAQGGGAAAPNSAGQVVNVSENSLVDVPRGPLLGIAGAPTALPSAGNLSAEPWAFCSILRSDSSGSMVPRSVLEIASDTPSGEALVDKALLVRETESGQLAMVWHNYRYAIGDQQAVLTGLGYQQVQPVAVSAAWLSALPAGSGLDPIEVSGRGGQSTAVPGAKVGQVFRVRTQGSEEYYTALAAELKPITPVQSSLLLASAVTRPAYAGQRVELRDLSLGEAAAARKAAPMSTGNGQPPASRPEIAPVEGGAGLCASYVSGATTPQLRVGTLTSDKVSGEAATTGRNDQGTALADEIHVRPGWGALAESMPTPGTPAGVISLVTDDGVRYPLAAGGGVSGDGKQYPATMSPLVVAALGYISAPRVKLPASLIARLPTGPALSPTTASAPIPKSAPS